MSREDAKKLSDGMESGITWRQAGIKHRATNEILLDVIETLDAILDQRGLIVNAEVSGVVRRERRFVCLTLRLSRMLRRTTETMIHGLIERVANERETLTVSIRFRLIAALS